MESQRLLSWILMPVLVVCLWATAEIGSAADELAAPTDFKVVKYGAYDQAKLTWSKVKGASGYRIYRATSKKGKYKRIKQTNAKTCKFINKKLKSKAVYYYKIRAIKKIGGKVVCGSLSPVRSVTVKYNITGTSKVTAEDLANYFRESGHKFPAYYKGTDAPTLTQFCQIYVDEAEAEGIRAEVAFSQAMLETGWLSFGGDVSIKQHNFAGLGAVGGGAKGNSFSTVAKGVRAQIQHLKAYANKKALKQGCVDQRFKYVTRGQAPYVEWLGIPDNPKKQGWAASKGYGYTIVRMIENI